MDFNWKTNKKPKITLLDSLENGRVDIASKAAQALIQWTAKEWEREHNKDQAGAATPLPDKLQV